MSHAASRRRRSGCLEGTRPLRRYAEASFVLIVLKEQPSMASPHPTPPKADHPILEIFLDRWSPYAYDPRPVEREKLLSCLEAARWAPSSYNEQPWTFILAERTDVPEFSRMLECLVEANS